MAIPLRSVVCASPVTYCAGLSIPMWKLSTGEPCAGEPHARFGGRGGRALFPTPINGGGTAAGAEKTQEPTHWIPFVNGMTTRAVGASLLAIFKGNSIIGGKPACAWPA